MNAVRSLLRLHLKFERVTVGVPPLTVVSTRPLPLPVAQRLELSRPKPGQLLLRVAKDRRGRIAPPRPIVWARRPLPSTDLEARRGQKSA